MVIALTIFLAALQVADWHTTRTILTNGGREQNPISKWLMGKVGINEFLIVKGVFVVALGYWIGLQSDDLLAGVVVIYCVVIYHNWKSL